jgi:hypothetical protein
MYETVFWIRITLMRIRILLVTLMGIRIRILAFNLMWIHADPDPQHWYEPLSLKLFQDLTYL